MVYHALKDCRGGPGNNRSWLFRDGYSSKVKTRVGGMRNRVAEDELIFEQADSGK